jgi:hypothetical protein
MTKYISKEFANKKSPIVGEEWKNNTNEERISLVQKEIMKNENYKNFITIKADINGQVVIKIEELIPASKRGVLLLELEKKLKNNIDAGITVWLEPVGDKSKLRNLRGISFKEV